MKILHVITGVNVGGAEAMLAKLLEYQSQAVPSWQTTVLSLVQPGAAATRIAACAQLETADMREGVPTLSAPLRVRRIAARVDPDLVVGWMHHGNLAAWLAATSLRRKAPLVWNVRHSLADIREEKPLTQFVLRLGARLSHRPNVIAFNSAVAARQYQALGYHDANAIVIPNGFDCARYRPRSDARSTLRQQIGVAPEAVLVGMIARLHPMKDPETLVEAVRLARTRDADIHLLLAGRGMDKPPPALADALAASLPADRLTLMGHQDDLPELMPGLDLLALPSAWGEGFPNTLAEAMACGVPCLATDVGDSASIVAETGRIVPPRDAEAMAKALLDLVAMGEEGRARLGVLARQRVCDEYAIDDIGSRITALYRDVVQRSGTGAAQMEAGRDRSAMASRAAS